ncbi:hypothetical protein ACIQWQ_20770 [Peribacillus frigoritolerans]
MLIFTILLIILYITLKLFYDLKRNNYDLKTVTFYTGVGIEGFAEKAAETLKKENVSVLKAAVGIKFIDSTHSDEHEHGGEETHSDELEHESEETDSDDHEGEEGATEDHVHEDDGHDHGDLDSRVWLDSVLAIDLANNI